MLTVCIYKKIFPFLLVDFLVDLLVDYLVGISGVPWYAPTALLPSREGEFPFLQGVLFTYSLPMSPGRPRPCPSPPSHLRGVQSPDMGAAVYWLAGSSLAL